MSRTHKELIQDYLWSISPDWATNSQIRDSTSISSHQQVYLLTQELMHSGLIHGKQHGRAWVFWANESPAVQLASPGRAPRRTTAAQASGRLSPSAFQAMAREMMSKHLGVPLPPGRMPGVRKE